MSGTALLAPARRLGNPPPRSVSIAFFALVAALFAGVGEAIAQVASILARADADMAALVPGLIFRSLIYLLVLFVAVRMTHGDRWARLVLTIGIGIVGLA